MKSLITSFILICFLSNDVFSQQLPLFNMYRDHWNVINPAALSNNYLVNERTKTFGVSYRNQWLGVPESPQTQIINAEIVSDRLNSTFGGRIINDQTGKIGQTGIYANYAYRLNLGKRSDQSLSIGLNAGVVQYSARLSEVEFFDKEEQSLQDDNLIYPDFGFGMFYHFSDKYYAGLSIPQMFGLNTQFKSLTGDYSVERVQHLYFVAGGNFQVTWFGNETSFIEPSIWFKFVPDSPTNVDVNARYQISELVWVGTGAGFGFGEQLGSTLHLESGVVLGEQINLTGGQLKVGLAFDMPLTGFGTFFGKSIEAIALFSL